MVIFVEWKLNILFSYEWYFDVLSVENKSDSQEPIPEFISRKNSD